VTVTKHGENSGVVRTDANFGKAKLTKFFSFDSTGELGVVGIQKKLQQGRTLGMFVRRPDKQVQKTLLKKDVDSGRFETVAKSTTPELKAWEQEHQTHMPKKAEEDER